MSRSEPVHRARRRRLVEGALALGAMLLALLAVVVPGAGTASAHTGFESSTPADGDVVTAPVDEVTIRYTGPAEPAGDEFQALDGDGSLRTPTTTTAVDDRTFVLAFDPPLSGGTIGIRWSVAAPDTHPIAGSFSFTVDAPAPTSAPPTTTPAADPAPTTTAVAVLTDDAGGDGVAAGAAGGDTALAEFLEVDASVRGEGTARVGRIIGYLGVALALGGLAFAATTFRGTRGEVRAMLRAVQAAAAVLAVGALVEYVGVARMAGEALGAAWSTEPGFAAMLRVIGGVAIASGIAVVVVRPRATSPDRARPLSAAPVVDEARSITADGEELPNADRCRWAADRRSALALVGAIAVLTSFWFDGHTVSKGFRPLHALVNTVHVAAGSVWVGGVVALAAVAWWRFRAGRAPRLAEMTVRFSSIATVALGSVVVAGGVMAVIVLDSFGELTSTQWGQTLLLKTAAVALAAAAGAYNHVRLVPRLEADPESPELQAELRSTVTAEAILLAFVVVVTAWLVVAAS